jgi:hypothetical protein
MRRFSFVNRRWLAYGGVGAGLVVAAIVAVIAFQSLEVPLQSAPAGGGDTSNPSASASGCSPTPCADVQGYTLHISQVQVTGNLVSMQVIFRNSSDSTHASPEDLRLVDSKHNSSGIITGPPGCSTWDRHEFNNGAVFGPIYVCFRVTSTESPLTLQWSPDFGFFCCQTDILIA